MTQVCPRKSDARQAAYTYDSQQVATWDTDTTHDCGPPISTDPADALTAVNMVSRGASARLEAVPTCAHTTYGTPSSLAPVNHLTDTTQGLVEAVRGEVSPVQRSMVAAKSGPAFIASADGLQETCILPPLACYRVNS